MPRPSASSRVRTLSFSSGVRAISASTLSRRSSSGAWPVPLRAAAIRSKLARFIGTEAMISTKKPTSSVSMSA